MYQTFLIEGARSRYIDEVDRSALGLNTFVEIHRMPRTSSVLASEEDCKLQGCVIVVSLVILLPDTSRLAFQPLKYLGGVGHSVPR